MTVLQGVSENSQPIQTTVFHEPINSFKKAKLEWKAVTLIIPENNKFKI